MCTVSVIPLTDALDRPRIRIACNRDELRTRARAVPPAEHDLNGVRAVMPIDPDSGGTWIAANKHGLFITLLNRHPGVETSAGAQSRGGIVPALITHRSLDDAVAAASAIDAAQQRPFRLVMVQHDRYAEAASDGAMMDVRSAARINEPLLWCSSGLGDHLVDPPRRALFREMLTHADNLRSMQDAFHRHRWDESAHLSVSMSRRDARTVSLTTVELASRRTVMTYTDGEPGRDESPAVRCELLRQAVVSA